MPEKRYRIGEVSKITGISKDTLHFYNKAGLLIPDYTDPENGYRYYSRWNLWQLDIITICRRLGISLQQVKAVLEAHDNNRIAALLREYREEALRLSRYYQQAADDILWYWQQNQQIQAAKKFTDYGHVTCQYFDQETAIAGVPGHGSDSCHANLQMAAQRQLKQTGSIRRRYGYILDIAGLSEGEMIKRQEYLKIDGSKYELAAPENLLIIPAGEYAVCRIHVMEDRADFSPLLDWLNENGRTAQAVYAEEIGLQLFDYLVSYDCLVRAKLTEKKSEKNS